MKLLKDVYNQMTSDLGNRRFAYQTPREESGEKLAGEPRREPRTEIETSPAGGRWPPLQKGGQSGCPDVCHTRNNIRIEKRYLDSYDSMKKLHC